MSGTIIYDTPTYAFIYIIYICIHFVGVCEHVCERAARVCSRVSALIDSTHFFETIASSKTGDGRNVSVSVCTVLQTKSEITRQIPHYII